MTLPLTTLTTLNRQQLGEVFKDPRTLLAFERIQRQVAEIIPETFAAFQNLDFVVTSGDTQIPNAHVITEGANIDVAVAAGLVTITATPSGADHQIQFNNAGAFGAFTLGGDATINTTTGALTLATVNANVGSFGDGTHVATFTVNAKGLTTAAASVAIPNFTSTTNGFAPLSGGGTVNFLRADGTWAAPPGAGGTVTNVSSANGDLTVANPTTTPVLTINSAPKLDTARTIAMSGDVVWSTSFDGSGNVTAAGTIQANAVTTTKINNSAVTLAKIANASANSKLLGSGASGSGAAYSELTLGTGLSMSGTTLNISGVIPSSGGLIGIQVITATGAGTYTPTAGTNSIIIQLQGAGGGGGGVPSPGGSNVYFSTSSGGGAFLQKRLTANFSGASYSVGAKGTGGSAGANNGTAGGNTSFTTTGGSPVTYTANGSGFGVAGFSFGTTPFLAGGSTGATTSGNGDINIDGGPAGFTIAATRGSMISGQGGASQFSRGAASAGLGSPNTSAAGNNAAGYGGGGSAAVADGTGAARAGGNGSDGLIVIYEYS